MPISVMTSVTLIEVMTESTASVTFSMVMPAISVSLICLEIGVAHRRPQHYI